MDPSSLASRFGKLFGISLSREANVAQIVEWREGVWAWKLSWRRGLFVWEINLLDSLLDTLNSCNIVVDIPDGWCRLGSATSPYTVKSAYLHLTCANVQQDSIVYKYLGDKSFPLKVGAFCWRSIMDRIPTFVNLGNREFHLAAGNHLCYFFNSSSESVTHLFLSCNFSYYVGMHEYLVWIRY